MKNQSFQEEVQHLEIVQDLMEQKVAIEKNRLQERDLDIARQDTIQYGIQQLENQLESPYLRRCISDLQLSLTKTTMCKYMTGVLQSQAYFTKEH